MDADVAIVGLGAMGSMAAWHLARAGARVIGFEQYGLAHDRGASAGESRLFRMAYHEAPEYVPLLRRSRDLWLELGASAGLPLFTPTGCLSIGAPRITPMRNVQRSVLDYGLEHELLDTDTLRRRFPQHAVHDDDVGILDAQGGVLRPELGVLAALDQARSHGATLLDRTPVDRIDLEAAGGVRLHTAQGTFAARRVVVSAGPWTRGLLPDVGAHITVRPLVLTWFAPRAPRDYTPERFPAFIRDHADIHLFGVPVMDGMSVKTGFADTWGDVPGPEGFTRDLDETRLRPVTEAVAAMLPGLHPDPVRHSVYMDGYTADRTALAGTLPGAAHAVLLAGFSGHGFKMAPVFGQIAAELALEGGTVFDIARMRPDRVPGRPGW